MCSTTFSDPAVIQTALVNPLTLLAKLVAWNPGHEVKLHHIRRPSTPNELCVRSHTENKFKEMAEAAAQAVSPDTSKAH